MAIDPNRDAFKDRIAKASEKYTQQAATRYLRFRSLLEEAGSAVDRAEIPKYSVNRFGAKLLKARRLLDRGQEKQVGFLLEEIIDEIRNDIKENENGILLIKNEIKDSFPDVCNPQSPKHGSRPCSSTRSFKKLSKIVPLTEKPTPPRSSPQTLSILQQAQGGLENCKKRSLSADNRLSGRRRKAGGQQDENDIDDEVEVNTLTTLQLALQILQDLPKTSLTDHELAETEEALKMTKPLLMTHEGCQKLRPFLETLKTCLSLVSHRRQPELSMALQGIRIVTYEVTSRPRKGNLHGILDK